MDFVQLIIVQKNIVFNNQSTSHRLLQQPVPYFRVYPYSLGSHFRTGNTLLRRYNLEVE
jgi:hypothetical protein